MGNTCFFNAALQVLVYCAPLSTFLSTKEHSSKCRMKGFCLTCNFEIFVASAKTAKVLTPSLLVGNLRVVCPRFKLGRQEDSHEYLRLMLELMQKNVLSTYNAVTDERVKETCVINRIFGGYLVSSITCSICKYASMAFDANLDLSLDVAHPKINSLKRALNEFIRIDVLEGDNAYRCSKCKVKVTAHKQMRIYRPPNILMIQFKRFAYSAYGGQKCVKHIAFEASLNLKDYMKDKIEDVMYDLYAVLVHSGASVNSGHYYSFCKAANGVWFCCDDSLVRAVSIDDVLKSNAYILCYVRRLPVSAIPPAVTAEITVKPTGKPALVKSILDAYKEDDNESDQLEDDKETQLRVAKTDYISENDCDEEDDDDFDPNENLSNLESSSVTDETSGDESHFSHISESEFGETVNKRLILFLRRSLFITVSKKSNVGVSKLLSLAAPFALPRYFEVFRQEMTQNPYFCRALFENDLGNPRTDFSFLIEESNESIAIILRREMMHLNAFFVHSVTANLIVKKTLRRVLNLIINLISIDNSPLYSGSACDRDFVQLNVKRKSEGVTVATPAQSSFLNQSAPAAVQRIDSRVEKPLVSAINQNQRIDAPKSKASTTQNPIPDVSRVKPSFDPQVFAQRANDIDFARNISGWNDESENENNQLRQSLVRNNFDLKDSVLGRRQKDSWDLLYDEGHQKKVKKNKHVFDGVNLFQAQHSKKNSQ